MDKAAAAMSYDELRGAIAQRHRALSGRLQQIAEFVLDHPTEVALGTVAEVAERSGVPPSAIVRFAHALGFGGFTQMQQVFPFAPDGRRGAELQGAAGAHEARGKIDPRPQARGGAWAIRRGGAVRAGSAQPIGACAPNSKPQRPSWRRRATSICLGLGGSFPVATHLAYVLRKLGRRVVLLDGIGGSIHEQSHPATAEDALVAISFRNYYPDTARLFPELVARSVSRRSRLPTVC